MISIIVCSVNEKLRNQLQNNIQETIGETFEFLYIDNKIEPKGICSIYNELANKAKGEYFCFIHEDVLIETPNWGSTLIKKASEKSTGIIGFAGAGTVIGAYPHWRDRYTSHSNYIQRIKTGEIWSTVKPSGNKEYNQVSILDGMFLFCRKEVWLNHNFDDELFKNFHLYDMDFSFSAAQHYKNYVCNTVIINHFSLGHIDQTLFDDLILFHKKWNNVLPYTVYPNIFHKKKAKAYHHFIYGIIKDMVKRAHLPNKYIIRYMKSTGVIKSIFDYRKIVIYIFRARVQKKSTAKGH